MSQSVIQSAVTNKTLRLELDHRQASMLPEGDAPTKEPVTDTELTLQHDDPQLSDEFACLLSVISGESGEFS